MPVAPALPPIGCLLVVLATAGGCSRPSPYLAPIEARTPLGFTLWRTQAGDALTTEEWRWFDRVVQEHRYVLMQQGLASGSDAVDAALRKSLDGRPLSEVMREGLQMLLRRKTAELDELSTALKANESRRHRIRPHETQKLHDFELHQEELRGRIARQEEEIAQIRATFTACEAKAGR